MIAALALTLALWVDDPAPPRAPPARDVCYALTVRDLLNAQKNPDGVPSLTRLARLGFDRFGQQHLLLAFLRVKLERGEGALLDPQMETSARNQPLVNYVDVGASAIDDFLVCVRVAEGVRPRGELWLPVATKAGEPSLAGLRLERFAFEFPADSSPAPAERFAQAVQQDAARLALLGLPGKPCFDARARGLAAYDAELARVRNGGSGVDGAPPGDDDFTRTFELFSGGRALQENLQVDRMRGVTAAGAATVAVDSITGITIEAVDFAKKLEGVAAPRIEPLAAWVPADQIYVGFPSFTAMTRLLDEMQRRGDSLVQALEPRGEDARTRARLERQLCLSTSLAARLLGPAVVKSVAFTAADPYLREGTDVALLFECLATLPIEQRLALERAQAGTSIAGCVVDDFDHAGTRCSGLRSPDRRVSSYSATVGDVVLVANSRAALSRLIDAHAGALAVHAKSDEFRFFRTRYPLAPERDAALIVLSDAFLRRFCGPAWRIAESRRLRCAAVQSRLEGLRAAGATEDAQTLAQREQLACPGDPAATFSFVPGGARCSLHGGAGFMTPVAETPVTLATPAERDAYAAFRDRYQSYWRRYFDPIAIEIAPGEPLAVDMTVMPLIASSDYSEFRDFAYGGGELSEKSGDPHPDSIAHMILHVNPESRTIQELTGFLGSMPGMHLKGVPWLGDSVEFFVDDSPLLDELARADDPKAAFENHVAELPVALRVAVREPLSFALFLSALRALVESSLPGATTWETRQHGDLPYVVVRGNENAAEGLGDLAKIRICYGTVAGGCCFTLDEKVLQRALDRATARAKAAAPPAAPLPSSSPWLGGHVAMSIDVQRALAVVPPLMSGFGEPAEHDAALCFSNLPALDAWHARDAGVDPVEQHADLFGVALVCPAGGTYAWDAALGAVACSKHGHPLAPKRVDEPPRAIADLRRLAAGITFEEQGVRVRVQAERMK